MELDGNGVLSCFVDLFVLVTCSVHSDINCGLSDEGCTNTHVITGV
jgi:hypothetical protein